MKTIKNLNNKRVFDISEDKKVIEIRDKDCYTIITVNPNGTLKYTQKREPKAA